MLLRQMLTLRRAWRTPSASAFGAHSAAVPSPFQLASSAGTRAVSPVRGYSGAKKHDAPTKTTNPVLIAAFERQGVPITTPTFDDDSLRTFISNLDAAELHALLMFYRHRKFCRPLLLDALEERLRQVPFDPRTVMEAMLLFSDVHYLAPKSYAQFAPLLTKAMPGLPLSSTVFIMWQYTKEKVFAPDLFLLGLDLVVARVHHLNLHCVHQVLRLLNPQQAVAVFPEGSKGARTVAKFYNVVVPHLIRIIPEQGSADQLAKITWWLASHGTFVPEFYRTVVKYFTDKHEDAHTLVKHTIYVKLLWALAKGGVAQEHKAFISRGIAFTEANLLILEPQSLSMLLWTFAQAKVDARQLFSDISHHLSSPGVLQRFSPMSIVTVILAFTDVAYDLQVPHFHRAIHDLVSTQIGSYDGEDTAAILNALARCNYYNPTLMTLVADQLVKVLKEVSTGAAAAAMSSLVTTGLRHAALEEAVLKRCVKNVNTVPYRSLSFLLRCAQDHRPAHPIFEASEPLFLHNLHKLDHKAVIAGFMAYHEAGAATPFITETVQRHIAKHITNFGPRIPEVMAMFAKYRVPGAIVMTERLPCPDLLAALPAFYHGRPDGSPRDLNALQTSRMIMLFQSVCNYHGVVDYDFAKRILMHLLMRVETMSEADMSRVVHSGIKLKMNCSRLKEILADRKARRRQAMLVTDGVPQAPSTPHVIEENGKLVAQEISKRALGGPNAKFVRPVAPPESVPAHIKRLRAEAEAAAAAGGGGASSVSSEHASS